MDLKKILDDHCLWCQTCGEKGNRADLQNANLQYADLRFANLQDANLQYADLHGANLRGANLQCANLRGAYLQDADLRFANLRGAYLQDADLQDANLQDANLQYADLHGANLRGANLQSAKLRGAYLQDANLDMSCWPLWCGSLKACTDKKLRVQIAFHWASLVLNSNDATEDEKGFVKNMLEYLNKFYRSDVDRLNI